MHPKRLLPFLTSLLAISAASPLRAEPCCDPASPFRPGESYPETPATCETVAGWIERAPDTEARITMGITGKLTHVEFDGVLAYLVMCEEPGVQVMCLTYGTNGMKPGETVQFAGGYSRVGEKQVMLDPCLASRN